MRIKIFILLIFAMHTSIFAQVVINGDFETQQKQMWSAEYYSEERPIKIDTLLSPAHVLLSSEVVYIRDSTNQICHSSSGCILICPFELDHIYFNYGLVGLHLNSSLDSNVEYNVSFNIRLYKHFELSYPNHPNFSLKFTKQIIPSKKSKLSSVEVREIDAQDGLIINFPIIELELIDTNWIEMTTQIIASGGENIFYIGVFPRHNDEKWLENKNERKRLCIKYMNAKNDVKKKKYLLRLRQLFYFWPVDYLTDDELINTALNLENRKYNSPFFLLDNIRINQNNR
jgi:hypothetical protein